jgi:hypothetical protein
MNNNFNNNIENEQINNANKFVPNEIINYQFYEGKDNNVKKKVKKAKNNNNQRIVQPNRETNNNLKEENIIIIANKCDNIIKNNINNYYINQIGTINNNLNNNVNNTGNNVNVNPNKNMNNFNYNNNNVNKMKNNKQNSNNFNKINDIGNAMINNIKFNNKLINNDNIPVNNSVNNNNKKMKKQSDFEGIPQNITVKDFNTSAFNNSKILKNNIKNMLGTNHKQILGINNNNNYYFLGQNYATNNNIDSNITPKSSNTAAKIITNLSNKSNGKKFKIIENSNLTNYSSNNNSSSNKKGHTLSNNSNNKKMNSKDNNRNKHPQPFNVMVNSRKGSENIMPNSLNQFLGKISPKNSNNSYKYDPIISNYNPIKKNRNNRTINSKNKNYQNNENYEFNYNMNNINVNNYNMSSNKPLNNFNPNLIKRKGTPTAGHQTIKINNINNPVKIKNSMIINTKKPSTPDMIINKSATLVSNNSYIGSKYNNTNNLFNYGFKKNNHLNNNSIHGNKSKKLKNYSHIQRPATAPHKDKSKEKKNSQFINNFEDSKKSINNYSKNAYKANQRPASAGQGKNSHKEYNKNDNNNFKYSANNLNGFNMGKKIEIDFGNKFKNSFTKKRVASPQIPTNNKISLGNNNNKINPAKYRLPSPLIKSTNINGKAYINNINKSNTNFNMNKSASFNIK